ncbi:sodium:proton antiporter NhaD [Shewanella japonica]|uniref:sodium:proton antiporter NhaD n=1 Tax=Shewanella japonica TaxID=93973 RepID=UPI000E714278|nr:sodium:proton antiporter NhaD [Shewanella japonica]
MLEIFLLTLAVIALLSIIFEEITHINKAKTTLFLGCVSWITLFIAAQTPEQTTIISEELNENLLEIATLWLFLMSTMTFVAYLNAKGMIQVLVQKIFPQQVSVRMLMLQVGAFALVLSTFCDNVTATLVSLGLLTTFNLDNQMRCRMAVLIIFAVNSGGVALITGDVTTLMIFLAGKVHISELLALFIPATISVLLLSVIFSLNAKGTVSTRPIKQSFNSIDIVIGIIFLVTIFLTMVLNVLFAIPPVLTFLAGLSVMFLVGKSSKTKDEEVQILEYIRQVEYDTLLFFLGILLLVGMLKEIGTLDLLTQVYSMYDPDISNFFVGVGSAVLDNVPLTAALLKADPTLSTAQWLGLTYSVGVGGSLLVIGSAAGIIAMSKVQELTFVAYLKFVPALLLCYSIGYGLTLFLANHLHN